MFEKEINEETEFKEIFGVELSSVTNKEILNLWKAYDLTAFAIDDFTKYQKALDSNKFVVESIKNLLTSQTESD